MIKWHTCKYAAMNVSELKLLSMARLIKVNSGINVLTVKIIDMIKHQTGNFKKLNWARITKNTFALMMHIDAQLDE